MTYVALFEFVVECVHFVVESSCSDLPGFIDEMNGEKTALTTLIVPFFNFGSIRHANSDSPPIVNSIPYEKNLF